MLHPGAVYLHPDRAEKALEPFASLGRSDKGDLTKKRAEELPQPTATTPGKEGLLCRWTAPPHLLEIFQNKLPANAIQKSGLSR